MLVHQLQPFSTVTMSLTASLLSGYNTIGERRIKEKCKEQRIGKIKSIGRYTVWKFPSYTGTFFSKAESCRTSSFGEHSLPVLLPSHREMLHLKKIIIKNGKIKKKRKEATSHPRPRDDFMSAFGLYFPILFVSLGLNRMIHPLMFWNWRWFLRFFL